MSIHHVDCYKQLNNDHSGGREWLIGETRGKGDDGVTQGTHTHTHKDLREEDPR